MKITNWEYLEYLKITDEIYEQYDNELTLENHYNNDINSTYTQHNMWDRRERVIERINNLTQSEIDKYVRKCTEKRVNEIKQWRKRSTQSKRLN